MLWLILTLIAALSNTSTVVINKKLLTFNKEIIVSASYFIFVVIFLSPLIPFIVDFSEIHLITDLLAFLIFLGAVLNLSAIYIYMKALKCGDLSLILPIRNTTPLFVAVLAVIFIAENVTLQIFAGIIIIMAGSIILTKESKSKLGGSNQIKAILYALAVAIMAAVIFTITKYSVSIISPFLHVYLSALISSILLFLFILFSGRTSEFMGVIKTNIVPFAGVGFFSTLAATSIATAASIAMASVVSAFLRIELLFGVVAGSIFFKETITKLRIIGAILIFIGLLLVIL